MEESITALLVKFAELLRRRHNSQHPGRLVTGYTILDAKRYDSTRARGVLISDRRFQQALRTGAEFPMPEASSLRQSPGSGRPQWA